jgi:hypothetical protein
MTHSFEISVRVIAGPRGAAFDASEGFFIRLGVSGVEGEGEGENRDSFVCGLIFDFGYKSFFCWGHWTAFLIICLLRVSCKKGLNC